MRERIVLVADGDILLSLQRLSKKERRLLSRNSRTKRERLSGP